MGATDFCITSTGKTADEAFRAAVEQARHEYGNDPYSGTIGTKDGFRELPADLFKGLGRKARIIILDAIAFGEKPRHDALGAKAWAVYAKLDRLPAADKWGNCYAVRINHNTFAFTGIAPE